MSKQNIMQDAELIQFLTPFFLDKSKVADFMKGCLCNIRTRRMLLRTHWYAEIADGIEKVRASRPALQIIFLMSLAEGVARMRLKREGDSRDSKAMIHAFFSLIPKEDKNRIRRDFRRALIQIPHHQLRFSSIVNILYDIRNRAVHGDDFYSFSLLDRTKKKEYVDGGYTSYGILTLGGWKTKRKRVSVSLDIKMTYEELRAVFVRTAIANIKKCGVHGQFK